MRPLIQVNNISKAFEQSHALFGNRTSFFAVRDVSLTIDRGVTLGIVGESGSGKSTLGRMAIGLLEPSNGDVRIKGQSLYTREEHQDYASFRKSLAGVVQMIFQDPYSSLNPRMRVGESVAEPLRCSDAWHKGLAKPSQASIKERVAEMLGKVGLGEDAARRYPHEFSGGQRQRVAIARALITHPAFVVCDEPTSSLDASVQSQVLNLLRELQDSLGLTYCFISHDLGVVQHMSDRVVVMYQGMVVEEGNAEEIFTSPLHPYTRLLLDSVPGLPDEKSQSCATVASPQPVPPIAPSRLSNSVNFCPFAPRCPESTEACSQEVCDLFELPVGADKENKRHVRCILYKNRQQAL